MRNEYSHPGWTGEPYASDFHAKWGMIRLNEMFDGTACQSNAEAHRAALIEQKTYFFAPTPSKHDNRLYKVGGIAGRCVVALLGYMQKNAENGNRRYRTNSTERAKQLVRVAKNRAESRGLPFDLDHDDVVRRIMAGRCEATGLPLDQTVVGTAKQRSPFAPSLDRVNSDQGYTQDNVQVVCLGWNLMKSNFDPEALRMFIEGLRGLNVT